MPNIPEFDQKIKDIIETWEYEMYLIHPDSRTNCTCQDKTTRQGDPKCPNCLGTGKKIYISKIKANRQPYVLTDTRYATNNASDAAVYYSRDIYKIQKNDIIVTGTYIDVVQYVEKYQSNALTPVYYAAYTAPKSYDKEIFYRNFRNIVGDDL